MMGYVNNMRSTILEGGEAGFQGNTTTAFYHGANEAKVTIKGYSGRYGSLMPRKAEKASSGFRASV